jgi:single-strand selective monofunctional uracil DNA glycosylase
VPEELPAESIRAVNEACDEYLRILVKEMKIKIVVGVGGYAESRAREALQGQSLQFAKVLHPSPASPVANRGWAEVALRELKSQGVW